MLMEQDIEYYIRVGRQSKVFTYSIGYRGWRSGKDKIARQIIMKRMVNVCYDLIVLLVFNADTFLFAT